MDEAAVDRKDDAGTGVAGQRARTALLAFALIFGACLFGIFTRPVDFLASLWPANAILLALLLRLPASRHWTGWAAAMAGYLAADLLTGAGPAKALLLNGANMAGVATAFAIYTRLPRDMAQLRDPSSMLCLVLATAMGAGVAGIVGSIANPMLFGRSIWSGWTFWFATELVNYVAILPVLLSAPPLASLRRAARAPFQAFRSARILPVFALGLSCLLAVIVGGSGAIAFAVPALLWCGLTYRTLPTALLTLGFSIWTLLLLSDHSLTGAAEEMAMISLRLGVALIAIAPVTVASIAQNRNELLARLRHTAAHDHLTSIRARGAFLDDAGRSLAASAAPASMLMLDIDHFKSVNDGYGHGAGDRLLQAFARRVEQCLRQGDSFGRMGGEEFAVFLPATGSLDGQRIAASILEKLRAAPFDLGDGRQISITASIGIATRVAAELEPLLADADAALYSAKQAGRDRWDIAMPADQVTAA